MPIIPASEPLFAVAMSGDGRTIAAAGKGGVVKLFDCDLCVDLDGLLALVNGRPPRVLTEQERKDFLLPSAMPGAASPARP